MKESKHKICMLYDSSYMKCPELSNSIEIKSRLVVVRGQGMGRMMSDCLMAMEIPFKVMKVF